VLVKPFDLKRSISAEGSTVLFGANRVELLN
jgi:hypothetical protein